MCSIIKILVRGGKKIQVKYSSHAEERRGGQNCRLHRKGAKETPASLELLHSGDFPLRMMETLPCSTCCISSLINLHGSHL